MISSGLLAPSGRAVTLYWDVNSTTAGAGGPNATGTWRNTTNLNWNTLSNGTGVTAAWTANSVAVFSAGTDATGTYTVTVSGTQSVDSIQILAGNITFSTNVLTLTGTTPSVDVASGLTATFGTRISGSAGFVKAGTGTVVFDTTSKNYTGNTLVNAGTLRLGTANMIGNTSAVTVASGATFDLNSFAETVGSIAGAGSISLGTATLTAGGDNSSTTYSGQLSGSGTLSKDGSGTLTLSGNSTGFSGALDLTQGTVVAASSNALGTASTGNTIANGAALHLQGTIALSETDLTIRGTGGGTGVLRNLSGNNSLAGTVTLATNSTIASDAGMMTLSGDVSVNTRTLTADGAGNITLSGALTGTTGKLTKDGSGTLTLSGSTANTFAGAVTLNDGIIELNKTAGTNATGGGAVTIGDGAGLAGSATLRLLANNQLPDTSGTVTINSDGRLDLNNHSETIDRLTLNTGGNINFATTGSLTVGANNSVSTISGTFTTDGTGAATFTKIGTGLLTINADLSFDGEFKLIGSLRLTDAIVTLDTLTLTGNSTIDFAGSVSKLLVTNLNLNGFTLGITSWANATDYFFATNWTGAVTNTRGIDPMDLVSFNGFTTADTQWQGYDSQVTPVPEPSTYGALLIGALTVFLAWRRRRVA